MHEVLHITQNLSGIPTYKLKFFRETFLPLFNTKTCPDKSADGQEEEKIIAITSRQLCNYYKENSGKSMSTNSLKETYLNEFINNGLIDEEDSILDKRQKIYYPVVDSLYEDDKNDFKLKIKKLSNSDRMDNILQHSKLFLPKNCRDIQENWLELEIFDLIKCPVQLHKFELYDKNNERLCICKFVRSFQQSFKLTGYFSKPIVCNYNSKIFGKIKYLGTEYTECYEQLSIKDKMDNIFTSSSKTAITNNILYSQAILAKLGQANRFDH